MQSLFQARWRTVAPLLVGLLFALSGCGGGGGGGGAEGSTVQSGASAVSTTSTGTASGTGAPLAEVRYALGPVESVEPAPPAEYQNLEGMLATPDGGWRIVWMTAAFDAAGDLQRSYFEQRYDAAGQRIGEKTSIAAPTEDMSGSRSARVDALGGGYVEVAPPDALRPSLRVQHFAADGTALDAPVQLGGAAHGWYFAWLSLPGGAIATTWQPLSSVAPGPLQTALLVPAPR